MSFSANRVLRDTFFNLWRNIQYALAAILTVIVSLSLVGAALLVKQGVANATVEWSHGVGVSLWMNADASNSEVNGISTQLKQSTLIQSCSYLDHNASYDLLKKLYSNQPVVVSAFTINTTPTIFNCVLSNPNNAIEVYNQYSHQPGVYTVVYPGQEIKTMEKITSILQIIMLGMALLMVIASLVLIFVTIRMAIFSRRREVAVMKLVGATNWFIRVPFMLEGMIEGLIGAVIASLLVFGLRNIMGNLVRNTEKLGSSAQPSLLSATVATSHEAIIIGIILIISGAVVGGIGSFVAVRRFLDV
jgi:cell division transport system permease protein